MSEVDDKRQKMWGKKVSKEEVLRELGDPRVWDRDRRLSEFRKRLRDSASELDIDGIRGTPGSPGYLDYLRGSLEKPFGVGTGLVSDEADADIRAIVAQDVIPEIARYETLLAEFEKSSAAVRDYLAHLDWRLKFLTRNINQDPDHEPIEELQELARGNNELARQNIQNIQEEIKRYSRLLETL